MNEIIKKGEKLKKADKILQKFIEVQPFNLKFHHLYVSSAQKQRRFKEALNRCRFAINYFPKDIHLLYSYGICLNCLEYYSESKQYFLDLIEKYPDEKKFFSGLAEIDSNNIKIDSYAYHNDTLPYFIKKNYDFSTEKIEPKPILKTYWWDGRPNFGDWLGGWLLSEVADCQVYNCSGKHINHVIYSVGSIIEHLNINKHENVIVWGSGLMKPVETIDNSRALAKLNADNILAVRGKKTLYELAQNIDIGQTIILGDPALALPHIYQPKQLISPKNISIVPHFIHYQLFAVDKDLNDNFNIINVCNNPKIVINQIASSDVVISSSLHGIIVAQAYKKPWIWLKVEDLTLTNDHHQDFKFFDFFSTMDEPDNFNQLSLYSKDITVSNILRYIKNSRIMNMSDDFQSLIDSIKNFLYFS